MKVNYSEIIKEFVNVGYLNHSPEKLKKLLFQPIDWKEMVRLSDFHSIRPIVYGALKKSEAENTPAFSYFENFILNQTFANLAVSNELAEILKDLNQNCITVLPYKGLLFLHKLFDNKQLREIGDADLLFHPDHKLEGVKYLINRGYVVKMYYFKEEINDLNEIEKIINIESNCEVDMRKKGFALDVHWGLNYSFLNYDVNYLDYFKKANIDTFLKNDVLMPDNNTIFWMILLHHGGKEFWVKHKHLIDLMAFLHKFSETTDWDFIVKKAKEFKVYNVMLVGFELLKSEFNFPIPSKINVLLLQTKFTQIGLIKDYWQYAQKWDKPLARLKYERILIKTQDQGFSKITYFQNIFRDYSRPNLLESGRYITFPENYYFLNFVSKVISYLIQRTFFWKW